MLPQVQALLVSQVCKGIFCVYVSVCACLRKRERGERERGEREGVLLPLSLSPLSLVPLSPLSLFLSVISDVCRRACVWRMCVKCDASKFLSLPGVVFVFVCTCLCVHACKRVKSARFFHADVVCA